MYKKTRTVSFIIELETLMRNKLKRITGSREMYLKLISIFPYKYSVPAECEIQKVIGALVARNKELLEDADDTESDEEGDKSNKEKLKVSSSNPVPQKYINLQKGS